MITAKFQLPKKWHNKLNKKDIEVSNAKIYICGEEYKSPLSAYSKKILNEHEYSRIRIVNNQLTITLYKKDEYFNYHKQDK